MRRVAKGERPDVLSWQQRDGVAILLSLGILSLVLIMAMSYAYTSQSTVQLANSQSDLSFSRMLAESAVQRAIGTLQKDLGGYINPANRFLTATSGEWAGRPYLASVNTDAVDGADDDIGPALNVVFNGSNFTPNSDLALDSSVGWVYVTSKKDTSTTGTGATTDTVVVGRVAWVILDESGKVDPSVIVDKAGVTAEGSETRTGTSMNELDLSNVLTNTSLTANFQSSALTNGQMPPNQRWFSHRHIFFGNSGATASPANTASVKSLVFPHSVEESNTHFWVDQNDDDQIDIGDIELRTRIDATQIASTVTAPDLYDVFVGYDVVNHTTRDDSSYYSAWLQSMTGYSESQLRRIAAQVAVNMVDYADTDADLDGNGIPSKFYVAPAASNYALTAGDPNALSVSYEHFVQGVEKSFQVGEVLGWVSFERVDLSGGKGGGKGATDYDMQMTPYFQVELFNPFDNAGTSTYTGDVIVSYEYQIESKGKGKSLGTGNGWGWGPGGKSGTFEGQFWNSITISPSDFDSDGNGRLCYNSTEVAGDTEEVYSAFTADPDSLTLDYFRLTNVEVQDPAGNVIDYMPDQSIGSSWIYGYDPTADTVSLSSLQTKHAYISVEAWDPRANGLHEADSEFNNHMTASSGLVNSMAGIGSIGTILDDLPATGSWYVAYSASAPYAKPDYGESWVADAAITNRMELGRISSWYPGRSLRFWTKTGSSDSANHDGLLLDVFQVTNNMKGTINLNTNKSQVLAALFDGVVADAAVARDTILSLNGTNGGSEFHGVGVLGGVDNLINRDKPRDHDAEQTDLAKVVDQVTVSQNFFTVIVCAQAMHDVGIWNANAPPGAIHWQTVGANKHYAFQEAEQKIMAVVYRDVFTNNFEILRYDYLNE